MGKGWFITSYKTDNADTANTFKNRKAKYSLILEDFSFFRKVSCLISLLPYSPPCPPKEVAGTQKSFLAQEPYRDKKTPFTLIMRRYFNHIVGPNCHTWLGHFELISKLLLASWGHFSLSLRSRLKWALMRGGTSRGKKGDCFTWKITRARAWILEEFIWQWAWQVERKRVVPNSWPRPVSRICSW